MARLSFEELKSSGRLPSPTGVGIKILRLTQDEDCSITELAEVLRSDPALTGRLLQLANASDNGSRQPARTVNEAAMRLGLRTVRSVSLGFSLLSCPRTELCPGFDYDHYWSECLARAVVTQSLSWRFGIGLPAEAFVLGLLAEVGTLALATVHPQHYAKILAEGGDSEDRLAAEREQFSIDHHQVTAWLMGEWGLPETFSDILLGFSRTTSEPPSTEAENGAPGMREILQIATPFATAFARGDSAPKDGDVVRGILDRFSQWDPEQLPEAWQELAGEWRRWGTILDIETVSVPEYEELSEQEQAVEPLDDSLRILAVDDDSMSLKLLSLHLERAGHNVRTAQDGREALRVALDCNPQVVIADWMMPEMNGLDLCRALRRFPSGREMYFILLTGQDDDDQIVEAFEEGVDDYIVKPFKPRILMARIRAGRRVIQLQRVVAADNRTMQSQMAELGVLNRKLAHASLTDPLTELPNRRAAMDELKEQWEARQEEPIPLSVIMVDIDHFKSFNDTYGHDVGDLVLHETAQVLSRAVRTGDLVCRLGGEEFLAILPAVDAEGALQCAERMRASLEAHVIRDEQFTGSVTASFGLAHWSSSMEQVDTLLKRADEALYDAKESGRNRVALAGQTPVSTAS